MKNTVVTVIFLYVSILGIYGQVETKFFPNRDALQQNRMLSVDRVVTKVKSMPPVDAQKIASARQQNRDSNAPFRFGEGFDTNITLSDGEWTDTENGRLWTMTIESKGAYSINFVFNDFYLPEGAELYISNNDGDMLYGPVTSKVNTENGHFLTDLIKGDKVTIYLFEPSNKRNEARLFIKKVVHAYENMVSNFAYGQVASSGSCNNDIACFPTWSKESDAIALVILSDGTEMCSGSLVMATDSSFKPYFLSAFHCIDIEYPLGSLSPNEITNAENWMFKFQYKMSSCNGGYVTSGLTYNRATFRAGWFNTDFALMELKISPAGDSRTSWLGWDRSGNTPTSGTGIHHPSGDVMKISFDYHQLQTSNWHGNNNHWLLNFDNGVVEHGSSGSPLLDPNKRVVGQLHGNQDFDSMFPYCEQFRAEYGQFHRSWVGGGTNSTRLSSWLDPNNSGLMTTNTSRPPMPRDLIVRDNKQDDGEEPNHSFISWASPDIWLTDKYNRRVYTAPVYSNDFHRVAVRIKNRGTEPVEGAKLFVHWTANTFNSKWVNSWTSQSPLGRFDDTPIWFPYDYIPKGGAITPQEGIDIPTIQPNEDTIVYVPWDMSFYDVCHLFFGKHFNDLERFDWGFSLLAAIDDGNDYPLYLVNYPTTMFAKSYNNVATHNARAWLIGEHYTQILPFDSIITSPFVISYSQIENEGHVLNDFAEVYAILSNDMIRNLNFENSKGIKQVSENRVILTSPEAELHFYGADGEAAFYAVGAQVNFISDKVPQLNDFDFEITLHATDEQSTPYTETRRMTAVRNQDIYFKAVAEADKDKVVRNKEYVVLNSNVLMDSASYVWFDQSGSKIGEGSQITVSPQTSQVYTVSITKDEDGYRSYGEIEVEALDGVIKSLSPNPANDNVTVVYELSDNVANASIRISNIEQTITTDHTIVPTATSQTIPLSGYSSGVYMVKLVIDGVVVDSKQLIIY